MIKTFRVEDLVRFVEETVKQCPDCAGVLKVVLYRVNLLKGDD